MTHILIHTASDDMHAVCVQLGLASLGHSCVVWYAADCPIQQTHSVRITGSQWHGSAHGIEGHDHTAYDVVWHRRPQKPVLPHVHPDDAKASRMENLAFHHTLGYTIAPHAQWMNTPTAAHRAQSQACQLLTASRLGWTIPTTLISNHPDDIRAFVQQHQPAIHKTLCPLAWDHPATRLAYTSDVKPEDLPSDATLQHTPGIFQARIPKAFELRINCFDRHVMAAKLCSQDHPLGLHDWRHIPLHDLQVEPFKLPPAWRNMCLALMRAMRLRMGCLDCIVTPSGELVFLEINEQGQFLWLESCNPDILMLNACVHFLARQSPSKHAKPLRLHDLAPHDAAQYQQRLQDHLRHPHP